ncbi:unnamed protein product [Parnassius mnemosyne]|uniref:Phenoloxidase-activating factor 2 n=1 Tax=Parnassius mnemosyne TaxID=213953 RepID=A0AAV1KX28_9NEOP
MCWTVLIVALVVVVGCEAIVNGGDLDAIMQHLENMYKTTSPTLNTAGGEVVERCMTSDKLRGECVIYYLCNDNNTANTDGSNVIDIRMRDGPCSSYLDTCCLPPDIQIQPILTPNPNYQRQGCGWRNPNGVGLFTTGDVGGEAKFAEFPWMVAILKTEPLFINENNPSGQNMNVYVGGGSLIHPNVVLTTAHYVVETRRLFVRAGEWDTQTNKEPYPHQDREVVKTVVHKNFNNKNLYYDIALLFLNFPMILAPNVGLACLPSPRQRVPAGTRCFASGWGKDKYGQAGQYQVILKKIDLPIVDRQVCQRQLRRTRLGRHFNLHSSFICAGGERDKDTCNGDGGSPLVCPIEFQKERYMQSGMVAWGIGCGEDGTPGVYVDVAGLRDWIDMNVAAAGYDTSVYSF